MARTTLLGAMNFGHLLGRPAARAEDEKPKDEKDKNAKAKTKDEDGDDDEGETEEEKKKRREEEDEQDEERREEDEDDKDERRKKEDEDDDLDAKDAKATAARRRERARCAAIFGSKHAAARPDMAAHLAFATDMNRTAARHTLAAIAAGSPPPTQAPAPRSTVRERMQERRSPQLGNEGGNDPTEDTPDAVARRNLAAAGIAVPAKK